jgi:acyl-CoA dehydrogenase
MDELQNMLSESATRLFKDNREIAIEGAANFHKNLWQTVQELGFTLLLLPEEDGGIGGSWSYVQTILQPAGYYSSPIPLSEAILAPHLLQSAGLSAQGDLVIAGLSTGTLSKENDQFSFSGRMRSLPWGRYADQIVTTSELDGQTFVVLLSRADASIREAVNLAGEPRDELTFENCVVQAAQSDAAAVCQLQEYAALMRLAQVVGALENVLAMTLEYANERKQFGRPISKFQAVQQQLAIFGSEVAAVTCAVRSAYDAADAGANTSFQIAAAKLRANMAIGTATATAHQVFAAIGFTWEHTLRLSTQRLLSWRSEYGNDSFWSNKLGSAVAQRGADNFWSDLTQRDDEVSAA